jgi:hypothetical protein
MVDLKRAHEVATQLHGLVADDPRLSEFLPAVTELVENARRLRDGDLTIGSIRRPSVSVLPDRRTAERIVQLAGGMPTPDGTEDRQLLLAMGRLHGNLMDALMHAIFASYPEIVREAVSALGDDANSIHEAYSAANRQFRREDWATLLQSLERVRAGLLSEGLTKVPDELIWLEFYLACLEAAEVKQAAVQEAQAFAREALRYIGEEPARAIAAIARYAVRCKAEGKPELAQAELQQAVEWLDVSGHWSKVAPNLQVSVRQLLNELSEMASGTRGNQG